MESSKARSMEMEIRRASIKVEPFPNMAPEYRRQSQSRISVEEGFYHPPLRTSWWQRFLDTTGFMPLRQRQSYNRPGGSESPSTPRDEYKPDFECPTPAMPTRTAIIGLLKGALLIVPIIVLVLFGILHILQVVIGRAALVWDTSEDHFLPKWGKAGYYGDGLADYPTDATRDILPVPVHSHNDYWRRIPFWEAIHYGCTGVEADVHWYNDDLYVGHNQASLTQNRTLRSLYIDPLLELLDKQNPQTEFSNTTKHGVFDEDPGQTLALLIDVKTDGATTIPIVEQQIAPLREKGYLTYFNGTHTIPGAVTVVGTGNTPFDVLMQNTTYRDIFFDAPLERLWISSKSYTTTSDTVKEKYEDDVASQVARRDSGQGNTGIASGTPMTAFNVTSAYYASVSFKETVGTVWRGHLSPHQMEIIRGQIRGAKKQGLKSRYWETPSWPISLRNHIWHVLIKEGAEMLNADDLRAAATQDWARWQHEWW